MSLENTVLLYDPVTIQAGVQRLVPPTTKRILDLGGGRGGNGATVKRQTGADLLCLADLSRAALNEAAPGVDATIICDIEAEGSIEEVFAAHGPFDLVLLLDVLEHLYDPWQVVARLHALLDEGGHLLASIPNVQNYRTIIRAATGTWRYRDTGLFDRTHLRFFGKGAALELMTCTGLTLAGCEKGFGPKKIDRLADACSFGLLGRFVTLQHQILVKKTSNNIIDPGFCGSAGPTA